MNKKVLCKHGIEADDIEILISEINQIEYGKDSTPTTKGTYCKSCASEALLDGRMGIDIGVKKYV